MMMSLKKKLANVENSLSIVEKRISVLVRNRDKLHKQSIEIKQKIQRECNRKIQKIESCNKEQKNIIPLQESVLVEDGVLVVQYENIDENQTIINNPVNASDAEDNAVVWHEFETNFLLDRYSEYISLVGPCKTYPTKKAMWKKISEDLLALNIIRTYIQCETRYKTVMKRKKEANGNKTSGSSRMDVEYDEIKMTADPDDDDDDNFTPEVLRGVSKALITKKKRLALAKRRNKPQQESMSEILLHIHQLKEDGRQKRHAEKLDLIRDILDNHSGN